MNILIIDRWNCEHHSQYHKYISKRSTKVSYIIEKGHSSNLNLDGAFLTVEVDDINDRDTMLKAAEQAHKQSGGLDLIIALSEFDLEVAGEICDIYNLPGYGQKLTTNFRNKVVMKRILKDADIKVPEFISMATELGLLQQFIQSATFPLIAKPKDGAGSKGCIKIENEQFFWKTYTELDKGDYQVEEFIDGSILHADGFIQQGEIKFFTASRYVNNCLDYLHDKPLGSVMLDSDSQLAQVRAFTQQCLDTLGLTNSAFHLEIIESKDGYCFLEVGARVGGAEIPFILEDVYNIDFIDYCIKLLLNHPLDIPQPQQPCVTGYLLFPQPKSGSKLLSATSMLNHVASLYHEILPEKGHIFTGDVNYSECLAKFRFHGNTYENVLSDVKSVIDNFNVELGYNG